MSRTSKTTLREIELVVEMAKKRMSNSSTISKKYFEKTAFNAEKIKYAEEIKSNKDFFLLISPLTPQSKTAKQWSRIIQIIKGEKQNKNLGKGGFRDADGKFVEIKCSTPSKDGIMLNLVQLRPHQGLDYYICCFIDDVDYLENYVFKLTNKQMEYEIERIGSSAHGDNKKIENGEKRLSLNLDDKNNENSSRWINEYRDKNLEEKLF